jgi:hypothetical protein
MRETLINVTLSQLRWYSRFPHAFARFTAKIGSAADSNQRLIVISLAVHRYKEY